jgi:glutamine synthetase
MQHTLKEVVEKVKNSPHNKVKLVVTDIDGILRGKIVSRDKFLSIADGGFGFCDVVFGWDAGDVAYDNAKVTGWHNGYPDSNATIDPGTYREIPWEDGLPVLMADFSHAESGVKETCPRTLLKKVIAKAHAMGFSPFFAQEFEWFNFRETPDSANEKGYRNLTPISPGMFGYSVLRQSNNRDFFNDIMDMMTAFDVPVEGIHTETGPGVYEAAVLYADALEAADRAVLFKAGVKEIAHHYDIIATFMAKISDNLPGCSGHVHQSLWDKDKKQNLFFDANKDHKMSDLMRSYMAGQLACFGDILPMVAPTINSYKRLVVGAWAPTTLTWGVDNRTTMLRALPLGSKSCRIETRVVGSDSNPYLAIAACLAAGLYGIEKGLKLDVEMTKGNGYENKSNGVLPGTLDEAANRMRNSKIANELFGETFTEHFTGTRLWEVRQFNKHVTDWEWKRYFEII